jgi:hypothetical protein
MAKEHGLSLSGNNEADSNKIGHGYLFIAGCSYSAMMPSAMIYCACRHDAA